MIYKLFTIYHLLFPSQVRTCRFDPTCSQYTVDAVKKYGLVLGTLKSVNRLLACHPFSTRPIVDPA